MSSNTCLQLVAETYIVAVLYAAVTLGFILMNDAIDPKVPEKDTKGPRNKDKGIQLLPPHSRFFQFVLRLHVDRKLIILQSLG